MEVELAWIATVIVVDGARTVGACGCGYLRRLSLPSRAILAAIDSRRPNPKEEATLACRSLPSRVVATRSMSFILTNGAEIWQEARGPPPAGADRARDQ
jgi:hypothetical protein